MIILIGPKHSGKSSVGSELARLLKVPFYDLDRVIEERTGQSVRELFNTGVELFQREEASALKALEESPENNGKGGMVVAAGGGITDNSAAVALLQNGHCIVYLDVTARTAWQRIASEKELPPFLKAETVEASMEKHRLLHERRANDCRNLAHMCVQADHQSQDQLAEALLAMIHFDK